MKLVAALAVLLLSFSHTGPRLPSRWGTKGIHQSAVQAYDLYRQGRIAEALQSYESVWKTVHQLRNARVEATLLASIANCHLALGHYREALDYAQQAKQAALDAGDCAQTAYAFAALNAIYLQLFNIPEAVHAAEAAMLRRSCVPHRLNRAEIDFSLGWLRSRQGRSPEAAALFERGIEEADRAGSLAGVIAGLHRLGAEALANGDLPRASQALFQAYRLRRLSRDSYLFISYYQLAQLRLTQGDPASARTLIDAAISTASPGRIPQFRMLYLRGIIRRAQGDLPGAVADLESAVNAAREWRGRVLPADTFRTSVDAGLQQVYDAYISAAIELSANRNSPALIARAWQAAEFNRAASLRESLLGSFDWRDRLDPNYWSTLAGLRTLEARNLSRPDPQVHATIRKLRLQLDEFETRAGLSLNAIATSPENFSSEVSLISVQGVLGDSRTLMSFQMGDPHSYRWTIGPRGIQLTVLPSSSVIRTLSADFAAAVSAGQPSTEVAHRLYTTLFSEAENTGPHWLLALSDPLFPIPFAALVVRINKDIPQYLVEQRTIEIVPGAWAIGPVPAAPQGTFVGVGDPVYNRADSRFPTSPRPLNPFRLLVHVSADGPQPVELPRLVGSGQEVERCARGWPGPSRVLTGLDVRRERLQTALGLQPAVLHIATHVIASPQGDDHAMLAFALQPGATPPLLELLTYPDVATLRLSRCLVVLSGCNSAAGRTLPGAGLLGLSRAFLSAGATGVITSLWPTPDDSGELFASFYRYLKSSQTGHSTSPAQALRSAQLDMLHSSSWRSASKYWAAYQLTGRSN